MKTIRKFIIVEHPKNGNDKAPDRKLKANFGTDDKPEWKSFGSGWIKEKQNERGSYKFMAVNLDEEREYQKLDKKEIADGFVILNEKDYKKLLQYKLEATGETSSDLIPF